MNGLPMGYFVGNVTKAAKTGIFIRCQYYALVENFLQC